MVFVYNTIQYLYSYQNEFLDNMIRSGHMKNLQYNTIQYIIALLINNTGFRPRSCTVIGKTRHVTSQIWSRIDWLTSPKIRIVGLSFAEVEMDKTVHLEFYSPLSGRSKHQFQ